MRFSHTLVLSAAPFALAASAAAASPTIADLLPPDTFFVAGVDDWSAMKERIEGTPLESLWNDPAVSDWATSLLETMHEKFEEDYPHIDIEFEDVFPPEGMCGFGVWMDKDEEDEPAMGMLVAIDSGAKAESVFRAWAETWLRPEFAAWRMDGRLPAVRCPLLVIQGAEDEYGTQAQVEAIACGVSGPAETLWLEGCGHSPHREKAAEVLAAVSSFVARQGLAGAAAGGPESR